MERAARTLPCPLCRREVAKVHDRRPRQDEPLGDRPVTVVVVQWRFRCPWDDPVCTEPEAEVGGGRRRTTHRLRARLGEAGSRQPVPQVAARAAVSPTTVERADAAGVRPTVPPIAALTRLTLKWGEPCRAPIGRC